VPLYEPVCESNQNRILLSNLMVHFITNIMKIFAEINIFSLLGTNSAVV